MKTVLFEFLTAYEKQAGFFEHAMRIACSLIRIDLADGRREETPRRDKVTEYPRYSNVRDRDLIIFTKQKTKNLWKRN